MVIDIMYNETTNFYDDTPSHAGLTEEHQDFFKVTHLVIGIFVSPILSLIGFIGNGLTFNVFLKNKPKSSTNVYFATLCISNSLQLLCSVLFSICIFCGQVSSDLGDTVFRSVYSFSHYVWNMSLCVSSWMILALGFNNYIAVHKSMNKIYTVSRGTKISISIFVIMMLLAIPFAFHYTNKPYYDESMDIIYYELEVSEMWSDRSFSAVYSWFMFAVRTGLPLLLVIPINVCSIRGMVLRKLRSYDRSKVMMITAMTIMFAACVLPDAIMSAVTGMKYHEESFLEQGLHYFTDALLLLNASATVIVCSAANVQFQSDVSALVCRKQRVQLVSARRTSEMVLLPINESN